MTISKQYEVYGSTDLFWTCPKCDIESKITDPYIASAKVRTSAGYSQNYELYVNTHCDTCNIDIKIIV